MCELERLSMILGKKVTDVKSMVKQFFSNHNSATY